MLSRRGFFGVTIGAAVVAIGWPRRRVPVLYGDGVHDDTEALEAWFNGRPVVWPNGSPVIDIISARIRTSRTIYVDPASHGGNRKMTDCWIGTEFYGFIGGDDGSDG